MDTRLVRSTSDKVFGGVCGGLARYFGIDATIVRLVFVLLVLSGVSPLVYLILWVVMPEEGATRPIPPTQMTGPTDEWKYDPYTGEQIKR